jgi:uncharacterized phage protein (TIGR01671 family)
MKFKIWSNNLEKFVDDIEWYINQKGELYYLDVMDGELVKCYDYKVLRFTGLHDLNGEEIYEGDIVKLFYHHENIISNQYIVKYNGGKWCLDDWICLSDYYLTNNEKYGDTCKVIKIGHSYIKDQPSR